jgi:hypothetical protein
MQDFKYRDPYGFAVQSTMLILLIGKGRPLKRDEVHYLMYVYSKAYHELYRMLGFKITENGPWSKNLDKLLDQGKLAVETESGFVLNDLGQQAFEVAVKNINTKETLEKIDDVHATFDPLSQEAILYMLYLNFGACKGGERLDFLEANHDEYVADFVKHKLLTEEEAKGLAE